MNDGYKQPYPDEALTVLTRKVVHYKEVAAKREMKLKPNLFLVQIDNAHLDYGISIHLSDTSPESLAELIIKLEKDDNSNMKKGRPSVIESAFFFCAKEAQPCRWRSRKARI